MVTVLQIIISVLLITIVVLQAKGTGLGTAWGGGGEHFHSKRGVERVLFLATIVLSVLFTLTSLMSAI